MTNKEFKMWPKTQRLYDRETPMEVWPTYYITEKVDGTNALVYVNLEEDVVLAGSRNKWITPEQDNFGFAKWVEENKEPLKALGNGYHYGEWAGAGIQRRYGLKDRRLYLFHCGGRYTFDQLQLAGCYHVPTIVHGPIPSMDGGLNYCEELMRDKKSFVNEEFTNPEGLILEIPAWGVRRKIVWNK